MGAFSGKTFADQENMLGLEHTIQQPVSPIRSGRSRRRHGGLGRRRMGSYGPRNQGHGRHGPENRGPGNRSNRSHGSGNRGSGNHGLGNRVSGNQESSSLGSFLPRGVKRRIPEIVTGLLLVSLGVALVLYFTSNSQPTREILLLSRNLERGQLLTPENVMTAKIPSESPIAALSPTAQNYRFIASQRIAENLAAGTPILAEILQATPELLGNEVVLGVLLSVGQYPVNYLSAGDSINVLSPSENADEGYEKVATGLRVYEVSRSTNSTDLFVSLLVPPEAEERVANSLSNGGVRLALRNNSQEVSELDVSTQGASKQETGTQEISEPEAGGQEPRELDVSEQESSELADRVLTP